MRSKEAALQHNSATKTKACHLMGDRISGDRLMQIGIDSFAAAISDPATGLTLSPVDRMQHLLEEIELADQVGLDVFGIGEHHRAEFLDSAPAVVLAAGRWRAKKILPAPAGCRREEERL